MAWLTSLLNRPKSSDDERTPSAEAAEEEAKKRAGGPPLAILAPDIAGISSFGLRFFPDAATAAAEIEKLPPPMRRGTHVFWALHDEPVLPEDGHREALVLIRANQTSDVVYAVSFVDMGSAWSFARFEARRGLNVSQLVILWAAFATVREELDGVTVLPADPPATRARQVSTLAIQGTVEPETTETTVEPERREEPALDDIAAAAEAVEEASLAAAETERREAEARRAEVEEAARVAEQAQEELRAARAAADAARARAEAETARRLEAERRLEEQRQAAETAARARTLADMKSRLESTLAIPADAAEAPSPTTEAAAEITSYAGDEETFPDDALADGAEPAAHGTVFAHAAATETEEETETAESPANRRQADGANDLPENPQLDDFDIAYEVARLLENRRFDKREEPFQGFDSPPGKF